MSVLASPADIHLWIPYFLQSDWLTQNQNIGLAAKGLSSSGMEGENRIRRPVVDHYIF